MHLMMNQQQQKQQKTSRSRKEELAKLYDTGKYSLGELGRLQEPPISAERIRQIIKPAVLFFCPIHDRRYLQICVYCNIMDSYPLYIRQLSGKQLIKEINLLKVDTTRNKEAVMKKGFMIVFLKEQRNLSIRKLSELFLRHRTSILNLYKKYASKKNS